MLLRKTMQKKPSMEYIGGLMESRKRPLILIIKIYTYIFIFFYIQTNDWDMKEKYLFNHTKKTHYK